MILTHTYANQLSDLVSPVTPRPLRQQRLVMVNKKWAEQLQLPSAWWQGDTFTNMLGDERSVLCQYAVAQKYGGHQFGQWNPMLGDGRGLLLGEVQGRDSLRYDLHLKGSGQTPYSRHADGRAVLRSTLREYIGGEALYHLGIPSSRSLCLFTSEELIFREQPEFGAMMIRTAPSHLRFGHFEYFMRSQEKQKLDALFEYTFTYYFPDLRQHPRPHYALLEHITLTTARLIALWQAYGFVHGVMNTDNMSIHGITFDYGPYAFIDNFKSNAVFNHSDEGGRYAFDQQPGVALWNLNALAHSFTPYLAVEEIRQALTQYESTFLNQFSLIMQRRLGLIEHHEASQRLVNQWLAMVEQQQRDYNHTLRSLSLADVNQDKPALRNEFIDRQAFDNWWQAYREVRLNNSQSQSEQHRAMQQCNPAVIARTHLLQRAIEEAEQGDFSFAEQLIEAVSDPYNNAYDDTEFSRPPGTEHTIGSLSCSS